MIQSLFIKCFLIGVSASSAMGPIFVLTFNNGATKGFFKGFLTALGAAVGDAILIFLGLMGALSIFETSQHYRITIDIAGGFLLVIIGLSMIFTKKEITVLPSAASQSAILAFIKPFLSTLLNPLTLFFFMFISTQLLEGRPAFSYASLFNAATATGLGSLSVLSSVSFFASRVGKMVNHHYLKMISVVTGLIMLAIGGYFFVDVFRYLH